MMMFWCCMMMKMSENDDDSGNSNNDDDADDDNDGGIDPTSSGTHEAAGLGRILPTSSNIGLTCSRLHQNNQC